MARPRPVRGFALLVDDPPETVDGGVVVRTPESGWKTHMDYAVASVDPVDSGGDYGAGDRVVIRHPNAGRAVRIDGEPYRLVPVEDILAVVEQEVGT